MSAICFIFNIKCMFFGYREIIFNINSPLLAQVNQKQHTKKKNSEIECLDTQTTKKKRHRTPESRDVANKLKFHSYSFFHFLKSSNSFHSNSRHLLIPLPNTCKLKQFFTFFYVAPKWSKKKIKVKFISSKKLQQKQISNL